MTHLSLSEFENVPEVTSPILISPKASPALIISFLSCSEAAPANSTLFQSCRDKKPWLYDWLILYIMRLNSLAPLPAKAVALATPVINEVSFSISPPDETIVDKAAIISVNP